MRADEYLVEEIIKLKEENNQLKEENEKLLAITQLPKEDLKDTTTIKMKSKLLTIYPVDISSKYRYGNFKTKEDLKVLKSLLANDKKLKETIVEDGSYWKYYAYKINDIAIHQQATYKGATCYIHYFEDSNQHLQANVYFNQESIFLNYEDALKYAQKESRKVIKEVIEKLEEKLNKEEGEKKDEIQ